MSGMKKRHPFSAVLIQTQERGKVDQREGHSMIEEAVIHSMSPSLFQRGFFFFPPPQALPFRHTQ